MKHTLGIIFLGSKELLLSLTGICSKMRDFLARETRMRVRNSLKTGHLFESEGFFGKGNSKASAKLPKKITPATLGGIRLEIKK